MNTLGTKKDYLIVSLIGLFFGIFLLPVLSNVQLPFVALNTAWMAGIIIGFVLFALIALYVAFIIGWWVPFAVQFAKFSAVGGLNTMVDIGVLSAFVAFSGIAAGVPYAIFKGISFIFAVVNSYFFNRHWVFGTRNELSAKEFSQFLTVSIVGLLVSISFSSLLVNAVGPVGGLTEKQWATASAFVAVILVLIVNFTGYKFFVFADKAVPGEKSRV
ncbi:GtrA family protein [Candidatus Wolfebacteria bacterium]|nr:GtrA family protein [Candidatus Wolfebacteria bacterium]